MTRNFRISWLLLAACLAAGCSHATAVMSSAQIRQLLVERVDTRRENVGIVVGVIEPQGQRVIAYGRTGNSQRQTLDGDTLFEIGSLTEVFTAGLLAVMARQGEVALDDPVVKYLPAGVPLRASAPPLRLRHLGLQTSGLPHAAYLAPMPFPMPPRTAAEIFAPLAMHVVQNPGQQYQPSNLGTGLLGLALANRARLPFDKLLEQRLCDPLGMNSTVIQLPPGMSSRLAKGHDAGLQPVDSWKVEPLAPADGLHSSVNDLLKFLAAQFTQTTLTPALQTMLREREATGSADQDVALGWLVRHTSDREIVWHGGAARGFRSYLAFDRKAKAGVVVVSNTGAPHGVDDIGRRLLEPGAPLLPPRRSAPLSAREQQQVSLPVEILERYTGVFVIRERDRQMVAEGLRRDTYLTIARSGDRLSLQCTGVPGTLQLNAQSRTVFTVPRLDIELTFPKNGGARATQLRYRERDTEVVAERVEEQQF